MSIGASVTLRKDKMFTFLTKLIHIVLPRIRDFRGIDPNSFDGRGNYNLGLKEQLIFPEISYDDVTQIRGLDISIVTTAKTDEEARSLLTAFGMPFKKFKFNKFLMTTDTIADMLTRIRNANLARHQIVQIPSTKITRNIAQVLLAEGLIESFEELKNGFTSSLSCCSKICRYGKKTCYRKNSTYKYTRFTCLQRSKKDAKNPRRLWYSNYFHVIRFND